MTAGVLLVHGYTGGPGDVTPLGEALAKSLGPDRITSLRLPGHPSETPLPFDAPLFESAIIQAANTLKTSCNRLVVFGHSTGGCLALSALAAGRIRPDLIVLAAVPRQAGARDLARWQAHRADRGKPSTSPGFTDVCRMVSLINRTGKTVYDTGCPVLILHGDHDGLVDPRSAREWSQKFRGETRTVILPGAGHHFPAQPGTAAYVGSIITGAVRDLSKDSPPACIIDQLKAVEPGISPFLERSPGAAAHLAGCPGAGRVAGEAENLPRTPDHDPVFANIEITTRCNLSCRFCMRTRLGIRGKDMDFDLFCRILERLPHAYRITLVGLGEPLLHPRIIDFVDWIKASGRWAGLVTNAHQLTPSLSQSLIAAGLDSIVFSMDAPDQAMAGRLRAGMDMERVLAHIKAFIRQENHSGRQLSKAVFTALSMPSLDRLPGLVDLVSILGVDVLMLSDLNFHHNLDRSLLKSIDGPGKETIREALKKAFSKNFPVLSVHGIEEFGLRKRYHRYLALPPSKLYTRPATRSHCLSPWQTLPVNVEGRAYLCDCQPDKIAGSLLNQPFDAIWNGALFQAHRKRMTGNHPPEICRICPRF